MPGRGRVPKPEDQRRNHHAPRLGEWQATPGIGWQHGDVPSPPPRLRAESRAAWATWMGGWFAAHWCPGDLPNLRLLIRLHDRCLSPGATGSERSELRLLMDSYGITPKGAQERRWQPPPLTGPVPQPDGPPETRPSRYGHLRPLNDGERHA